MIKSSYEVQEGDGLVAVNAIDAVWIAAAVLTTKSSKRKRSKLSNTDVCFAAQDIQDYGSGYSPCRWLSLQLSGCGW